jgi:pyruvate carboxylase
MNTIPMKTLVQALDALRSAEDVFDKQMFGTGHWSKTMSARVGLEYYVDLLLELQSVTIKQDPEGSQA